MENKYFIYCRKSSEQEDRQILSLDSQLLENKKTVEKYRIDQKSIVDIFKESCSAKNPGKRPKFNEMILRLKKGEADGIIAWHPNRLSRNATDMAALMELLDSDKLVEIVTSSQMFRNEPMDKFMFGFLCMQAKLENDNKGVDVKRGLNTKAEKGWLPSGAKPGYMNDKYAEKGSKTIKADPERFPIIKKVWDHLIYQGYSIPKLLNKMNNEWGYRSPIKRTIGGKPMCRSQLYLVLHDPFYYGYFEYPVKSGKWRKGSHEPMITEDEYNRAQIILGRHMAPRPHRTEFAYTGLIRCGECEARITAEEKWHTVCSACKEKFNSTNRCICPNCGTKTEDMDKPIIRHYIYYHCTKRVNPNCVQKSVEIKNLENQLDNLLGEIQISDRFSKWALKHLNELNEEEAKDRNMVVKSLQTAYTNCLEKLDNLTALMISPGNADRSLMSDEEFRRRKSEILDEKQKLESQQNNTGRRIEDWLNEVEEKFNFATLARKKFNDPKTTIEDKREMMFRISSNLKLFNKKVDALLENLYEPLRRVTKGEPSTKMEFEPKEIKDKYGNLENYWNQNPLVLPLVDAFCNRKIEFGFTLQNIQTVFDSFKIQPAFA